LADKDAEAVVDPLIPWVETWFLSQSRDPRAMPVERLAECLAPLLVGSEQRILPDLAVALDAALTLSAPGDCLLVFGSFTTVEVAMRRLGAEASAGILRH
jgi:dihydrofolate synthase/folylpolyglutamate synthase